MSAGGASKLYEQMWLGQYRQALPKTCRDQFDRLFVFDVADSRVFSPDYTVNVVVLLKEATRQIIDDIEYLGCDLSVLSETIPLIWVYTKAEWEHRKRNDLLPYRQQPLTE